MQQTLVVTDPLADLARLEGVPSTVAAAVAAVDAVLRDRGLAVITPQRQAAALAATGRASADLTGDADRWLVGSLRLAAELSALAPLIRIAPAQALARAHTVVARGQVPDADLGRVVDRPGLAERLQGLADLLVAPTQASAVVLAAVTHAELATMAPFVEANGLVARAAEHLVLISAGIDPRGVIVVEAGHQATGSAYPAGLTGYAEGGLLGVKGWLLHCAAALSRAAEISPR